MKKIKKLQSATVKPIRPMQTIVITHQEWGNWETEVAIDQQRNAEWEEWSDKHHPANEQELDRMADRMERKQLGE